MLIHQSSNRRYVLGALLVMYGLNFADRQSIGILMPMIKLEMGVSDTQLGLLTGLAFSLTYSLFAIPIAAMADRFGRARVLASAIAIWSVFTVLCGCSRNFSELFASRLGVGIGEAGFVAPACSMIADYYRPSERATALARFALGVPLGSAFGLFGAAALADRWGWRYAFILLGVIGIVAAVLFAATVAEPERGRFDGVRHEGAASFTEVALFVGRKPSFWGLVAGASLSSALIYGLAYWLPSYFTRQFGLPLSGVSKFYGTQVVIGSTIGLMLGGWLGDRLGPSKPRAYVLVPALCVALAIPFYVLALISRSAWEAAALFVIPTSLSYVWIGPVLTALQGLATPRMRSTASAIFLMFQNLIGMAGGAFLLGYLSDAFKVRYGSEALKYSIFCGLALFGLSALGYLLTARTIRRDLVAAAQA